MCPAVFAVQRKCWTILDTIHRIERDLDARVGVYLHDMQTGDVIAYAHEDRFPMNSTFKLLACDALLSRVDSGQSNLASTVALENAEIVDYSPAIRAHLLAGNFEVSLEEVRQMALSVSDNTAANIALSEIGGPKGLTAYLRSIGDNVTRLDRWETALNEAVPGNPRDTTTPRAMAQPAQELILGNALSVISRAI